MQLRAGERTAVRQPGFISSLLADYIFSQMEPLFFAQAMQRTIEKRSVKSDTRGVQLIADRDVELLLRDQQFDVAAPIGRWYDRVKERMSEVSIPKTERLIRFFSGSLPALISSRDSNKCIRPRHRAKDKTASGRLFDVGFCLLNHRILFQCGLKGSLQGNGLALRSENECAEK